MAVVVTTLIVSLYLLGNRGRFRGHQRPHDPCHQKHGFQLERPGQICPQQRLHVPGDQLVVSVGGEEPEVLVNVLVSTLILPDVYKLVLITDKHAEVTQAAPVKNIFVGINKTCEDK